MPRTAKPPKPTEASIQEAGMALLGALGWTALRRNTGAMRASYKGKERLVRFSEVGASDVYGFTPAGFHYEWEVKRPGNWPTDKQIERLMRMNGVGGAVAFWTDTIEDLELVARHVMAGGKIEYVGASGSYRLVT